MNGQPLLVSGLMSNTIYYIIMRALGYDRLVARPHALSDNARSYERACLMMRDHTWVHVRPSVTGREGLYDRGLSGQCMAGRKRCSGVLFPLNHPKKIKI